MLFCLARIELVKFYTQKGVETKEDGATIQFWVAEDVRQLIDETEGLIEMTFLRYCDILNPLHFLTNGIVQSATDAVRIRTQMLPLMKHTISDAQRREICKLAKRILDIQCTIYNEPSVKKFHWHIKSFFIWDALLCILFSLAKVGFYTTAEADAMWNKISEVYLNHEELVKGRRALHATIGNATLKAWLASPPSNLFPEPAFITALRAQRGPKTNRQVQSTDKTEDLDAVTDSIPISDEFFNNNGEDWDPNTYSGLGSLDWVFWD